MCDVYLLHFDRPISDKHTTQHYLGSADDLFQRIGQQRAGTGARLCQVAKERGIGFTVARIWSNKPRAFEYELKARKNAPKLCPICKQVHTPDEVLDFALDDVNELSF